MDNAGFKDLKVYKIAYSLAMEIFEISKSFPKEETYALSDQIRRSSRSICANLAEGYRKRKYPKHFVSKLLDCDGECSETLVWLDFAKDCQYITPEKHSELAGTCKAVGAMLGAMSNSAEKFLPRDNKL